MIFRIARLIESIAMNCKKYENPKRWACPVRTKSPSGPETPSGIAPLVTTPRARPQKASPVARTENQRVSSPLHGARYQGDCAIPISASAMPIGPCPAGGVSLLLIVTVTILSVLTAALSLTSSFNTSPRWLFTNSINSLLVLGSMDLYSETTRLTTLPNASFASAAGLPSATLIIVTWASETSGSPSAIEGIPTICPKENNTQASATFIKTPAAITNTRCQIGCEAKLVLSPSPSPCSPNIRTNPPIGNILSE